MKPKVLFIILIVAVTIGAFAFRIPRLDERIMHGDEANQADKTGTLLEQGHYAYDPHQHHGPTLYYLALPIAWLSGATDFASTTETTYRLVPLLFGVGLVLLVLGIRDGLSPSGALLAAILTAVSPAMVYYSRYYIQEMLLVFFTFGAIAAGWRYTQKKSACWAIVCGLCAGLMFATKETCVIAFFAAAVGLAMAMTWTRLRDGEPIPMRALLNIKHILAFSVAAAAISLLLFSSFFTHARGPLDSILAFGPYVTDRSTEEIHAHPWRYYLDMLNYTKNAPGPWWSERLTLILALIGIVTALAPKASPENRGVLLQRFLVFYTLTITAVYAAISYKTPWCVLSQLHGMILLAGIGAMGLGKAASFLSFRKAPLRYALQGLVCAVVAAAAIQLAAQAHRTCFVFQEDPRNPYAYAHAVSGVKKLGQRAEDIAPFHPDEHDMLIMVVKPDGDYWPLPWYVRRFPNVGYWGTGDELPANLNAPMIVTSRDMQPFFEDNLKESYKREYFGLRPGILLVVYIRQDLWDAFIETRK